MFKRIRNTNLLAIRSLLLFGSLWWLFSLLYGSVLAQGITAGGTLGVNFNNFRAAEGSPSVFSASPGLQASAVLNVAASPLFSLQTGVGIAQLRAQKSTVNPADTLVNLESNLNLLYADIPVLLKFTTGYKYRFFANIGPSIGLLLQGREKGEQWTEAGSGFEVTNSERAVEAEYKDFNVAFTVGGGLLVDNLLFEVRYRHGLTNLNSENTKSGTLSFTAGYLLYF